MRLVVGLGNPGARYAGNRHNIGFMVVDRIRLRHRLGHWGRGFHGIAARGSIEGEQASLLLPDTYMNDSGLAVGETARFYKLPPDDVIVVHDEIELPFGKVRLKVGGSNAGHNGLRSISSHIGNEYKRVRIGVGHPGHKDLVHNYVLNDFAKDERPWVDTLCDIIADNAELLVKGADSSFQNKVHLAMQAKGFAGSPPEGDASE